MLLFYFIYSNNAPLYLSKIPAKFSFSAMTVSRAANQLVEAGLLNTHKESEAERLMRIIQDNPELITTILLPCQIF